MTEKVDKKLIEQLMNGNIYNEEPKNIDPTKENTKDLQKGGGGK